MAGFRADAFTWSEPVTAPPASSGIWQLYVDHWWVTNDQGMIATYRRLAPQCNKDRRIVERLGSSVPGATGITQIPLVVMPHNCSDYV